MKSTTTKVYHRS